MNKRLLAALLALTLACALLPTAALASDSDFVIDEDGVLTAYTGPGGDVVISDNITAIGYRAFYDCDRLTSVTIPEGVTTIGPGAFYGCTSLTGVTIPDSVTTIEHMAFYWCASLTELTIPAGVTNIGEGAFSFLSGVSEIAVAQDNPAYTSLDGVLMTKDGTEVVAYPSKRSGPYAIPEGVTTVGRLVFSWCNSLTSITIPDSVTTIETMAFNNSLTLTDITVAEGNPVYTSQDGVVFNKDKTRIVAYPGGKPGPYTIPDSVTSIGDHNFQDCNGLTHITIPASVTSIGSFAFSYCSKLTNITVAEDNAVYASQDGVLFNKSKTELLAYPCGDSGAYTIPNSVTTIGDWAFEGCHSLTDLIVMEGVTSIGRYAFNGCPSLTVYGEAGSEAERYCAMYDIPFVVGIGPGTALTGSLESDDGKSLSWSITAAGVVTATGNLAPEEKILVGCYDSNGRFTGVKWLNAQHTAAQLDPSTPNVKLFWLGAEQNPLSPSVTVWGK